MSDFEFTQTDQKSNPNKPKTARVTPSQVRMEPRNQQVKTEVKQLPVTEPKTSPVLSEDDNDGAAVMDTDNTDKSKVKQYDQEELMRIFDDIMFYGEYTEQIVIKNKLKITFRTRTADEVDEVIKLVDATSANLVSTLVEKRSLLHLVRAMTSYHTKDLSGLTIEERAAFVGKLPGPVIGILIQKLSEFDEKVYQACKEGEENF